MDSIGLADYRANAMGFGNGPDEVGDSCARYVVCFNGEEVTNLMNGEPNRRQAAQPEEEEANEVHCVSARACRQAIWKTSKLRPDRPDHEGNTFT